MNDKAFNAGIVPLSLCRKYETDCFSAYLIPMDYSMLIFVESTSMLINVRAISTRRIWSSFDTDI